MKKINHINKKSEEFLAKYLNTASPTGFESAGQKVWLDYIKPYVDDYLVDTYGSVVGIINPEAKYKVVIEIVLVYVTLQLFLHQQLLYFVSKVSYRTPMLRCYKLVNLLYKPCKQP